ncbi:MAG TPA: PAS domain S-box protein [Kofleriaceae bacterium]|nr:PAS domain S-box protein [Kofleriaceae bacterium]
MELETDAYRLLFDANPLPMFVSDHDTLQIIEVNRAGVELYGWTRDELTAMTLRDIRPPTDVEFFEASFADSRKTGAETYSRAARHRTKDGRIIDVRLDISAITLNGRNVGLVIITNMTGIEEAERRFKLLVENSSDGISLTTADNVVQYVSPGGLRILGYDEATVIGSPAEAVTHPDDARGWDVPGLGEIRHYVARLKHRDGSWRWIESSTKNLTHDPAVRAYVSNYRDITERKLAEVALRKSETNFRTLIECAPAATFVHRDGRFVYVNPAAAAMLGHERPDEIVGRLVSDYVHPDEREEITRRLELLTEIGQLRVGQVRMQRADGSPFVIEGEAMLLDFDGVPSHVVIGHDVTERDAMFARIAIADRMLSIGTLAAGVAHEINNPLAYIATNLELLAAELPNIRPSSRSRLTDATLQCLVTDARDGVARVNSIVRDLRSLSRTEDQKPGPVCVAGVLASSIKMTSNEVRHRARVVQEYADNLPAVHADASRLGQVFVNLLLNAAQAIVEGDADRNEIRVSVRTSDDGTRVRVDIADTGTGIAPSIIGRIFDPFFTTKAPGAGTGLGLAISHQIVRSMGGDITVASQLGKGSTFSVVMPVAEPASADAEDTCAGTASVNRRILLVDDEAAVGRSLQLLLAPETEVIAVLSGEQALARLTAGEHFDAIVCDIMMPQSTGMQLYDDVARVAPEYRSRMIFMTGGAFTPQARAFLTKLDRPYLEKPFSEQELRDALARVKA